MIWKSLLAATIATAAAVVPVPAAAAAHFWQGWIAYQTTKACDALHLSNLASRTSDTQVTFRPHLKAGDPNAAIIAPSPTSIVEASGGIAGAAYLQLVAATTTPIMQGNGTYHGTIVDALTLPGQTKTWTGTYSFTVTPATVNANTPEIFVSGTVAHFENVVGCTLTFDAAFVNVPN